jgi:hypothetical protein
MDPGEEHSDPDEVMQQRIELFDRRNITPFVDDNIVEVILSH